MTKEMTEEMIKEQEEMFEAKLAEHERVGERQMNEYWEDSEDG